MVTSPTGKSIIVMGGLRDPRTIGRDGGEISKVMFELTDSMEWIPMEQTLQHDHYMPLAVPIPDELVFEKDTSNKRMRLM